MLTKKQADAATAAALQTIREYWTDLWYDEPLPPVRPDFTAWKPDTDLEKLPRRVENADFQKAWRFRVVGHPDFPAVAVDEYLPDFLFGQNAGELLADENKAVGVAVYFNPDPALCRFLMF